MAEKITPEVIHKLSEIFAFFFHGVVAFGKLRQCFVSATFVDFPISLATSPKTAYHCEDVKDESDLGNSIETTSIPYSRFFS